MSQRVRHKWRPPLGLVIGGALAGGLVVPLVGILWFSPVRQTPEDLRAVWLIFGLAVVSTTVLGYLLWRLVLRPVYALTAHARAMKAGRLDAPLPVHFGTPEFSDLGQSVIDMGTTLNHRAAGVRAFAGHVTHELKSPLTAIAGAAELLQGEVDAVDRAALAQTIAQAAARMQLLLKELRQQVAASQSREPGQADLATEAARIAGIDVIVQRGGMLPLLPADLNAVLTQLGQNAVAQGAVRLELCWSGAVLRVQDNGRGVAPGNRDRIFDPFFTTTRSDGGTGMGLSIVRALIEAQGGRITLLPGPGGATFEISF